MHRRHRTLTAFLSSLASLSCTLPVGAGERPERLEFTRMLAHWSDYAAPSSSTTDTEAEGIRLR